MTNLKLVLRTYSALRQMSPDDIALLETLRALNENDRELLLDAMADKPAGKKASKKSSKSASSSKSPRATGIERQLKIRVSEQREAATKDDNYNPEAERCTFPRDDGKLCFLLPDHNAHHMKSAVGFHPFQSSSDASSTDNESPANGGAVNGSESTSAASGD